MNFPEFTPFPAATAATAAAAAMLAAPPAHDDLDDKASILIVDDLPEKLLVFGTVLEEMGHQLVFVRSGREALRAVLQREFAVILLDVNMPDIDGFETATLIRQYKRSAHTPIIFITSYADELQTARGYALGAVDYILAPVVPQVLRSMVAVFVQLFDMQRQIRRQGDAHAAFVAAEAARHAAEDNRRRSAFMSRASRVLNRSLQVDVATRELAGLIVPRLAALTVVMPCDPARPDAPLLVASCGPQLKAVVIEVAPLALGALVRAALQAALRDRQRSDFTAAALAGLSPASFGLALAEGAHWQAQAACALPLVNGDRLLGAVFAVALQPRPGQQRSKGREAALRKSPTHSGGGRHAAAWGGSELDWRLLDDLALRAAAALENARLYDNLRSEITERRSAEQALREASRRKDEFLAMLSHELRNPLAPIRSALELIRRMAPSDPKFNWATDVMLRQLRQMTRLIDELLDVARISQGKVVLSREEVDLNAVIQHSVETAQPMVEGRNQTLAVTPLPEPVWMQGDFARLTQIVSNLLNNASKYSDKGTRIELSASLDEQGAVIRVRDQGIGIEAQLLPRIFELFAQGTRGLDRSQGGLGVGLTLAHRLAQMHGGSLQAASAGPGQGSEFTLRIPCVGGVQGTAVPAAQSFQASAATPPKAPAALFSGAPAAQLPLAAAVQLPLAPAAQLPLAPTAQLPLAPAAQLPLAPAAPSPELPPALLRESPAALLAPAALPSAPAAQLPLAPAAQLPLAPAAPSPELRNIFPLMQRSIKKDTKV